MGLLHDFKLKSSATRRLKRFKLALSHKNAYIKMSYCMCLSPVGSSVLSAIFIVFIVFVGIRGNGGGKGIRLKISPIQANESPKAKRICKQFKLTNSQHFCRIKMGEFFDN